MRPATISMINPHAALKKIVIEKRMFNFICLSSFVKVFFNILSCLMFNILFNQLTQWRYKTIIFKKIIEQVRFFFKTSVWDVIP